MRARGERRSTPPSGKGGFSSSKASAYMLETIASCPSGAQARFREPARHLHTHRKVRLGGVSPLRGTASAPLSRRAAVGIGGGRVRRPDLGGRPDRGARPHDEGTGQLVALPLNLIHRITEVVRVLTYSLRRGSGPLRCKDVGAGVPRRRKSNSSNNDVL